MATDLQIKAQLGKLSTVYRHPLDEDEFALIADVWAEVLCAVSDRHMHEAALAHMRTSRFFPAPADIMRHVEALRAEEYRQRESMLGRLAIPEFTRSEEAQCAYNAQKAQAILDMLSGEMAARA